MSELKLLKNKIPEALQGNEDFDVFLQLADKELLEEKEAIARYTDIIDPNKVPIQLLRLLGSKLGYCPPPSENIEFDQEALMRILDVFRMRGTDYSIVMAATHGDNPDWMGGDLFVPGKHVGENIADFKARITHPTSHLFTHNRSTFSGTDVYPDGDIWRDGVVFVEVDYMTDEIRQAINNALPAGVRMAFKVFGSIHGQDIRVPGPILYFDETSKRLVLPNGTIQQFYTGDRDGRIILPSGYQSTTVYPVTDMFWPSKGEKGSIKYYTKVGSDRLFIYNIVFDEKMETLILSVPTSGRRFLSGRQLNFSYVDIIKLIFGSYLPTVVGQVTSPNDLTHDIDYETPAEEHPRLSRKGSAVRDMNTGTRSGRSLDIEGVHQSCGYSMSGSQTCEYNDLSNVTRIHPNDYLYNIESILDKPVYGYVDEFHFGTEITTFHRGEGPASKVSLVVGDEGTDAPVKVSYKGTYREARNMALDEQIADDGDMLLRKN